MSNSFYNASGFPAQKQRGDSAPARTEFAAIDDAFDKLPILTGNGGQWWRTNAAGTAVESRTNAELLADVLPLGANVATFLATPSSANLRSALTDETGTGAAVFASSPTLVTPVLGTPASGTLTNCTGLPVSSGVAGLGSGVATFLATPSSANLASALTDEGGRFSYKNYDAFRARITVGQTSGTAGSVVTFDAVAPTSGSGFDTSTDTFTATKAGMYGFGANLMIINLSGSAQTLSFKLATSGVAGASLEQWIDIPAGATRTICMQTQRELAIGDTAKVLFGTTVSNIEILIRSEFFGHYISTNS